MHGASNRDTHFYQPHNNSSVHLTTTTTTYVRRSGGSPMECVVGGHQHKAQHFHPRHRHPPTGMTLPRRAWFRRNRLRTDVGHFRSCLCKWGMVSSAACECGAEEQTVDHVVFQCPIHRPPLELHGLTALYAVRVEWLLNICPEI